MQNRLVKSSQYSLSLFIFLYSQASNAGLVEYFDNEDGSTNWQYVANWSSGILILLLSIAAYVLYRSRKEIHRANHALTEINDALEEKVKERTATLDESNQLLKESNNLLEGEISEHRETTKQLHASEAYIKSILESMPIMVCGLNKQGIVTQWNKAAEKTTGVEAVDALNQVLWEAYPIMPVPREKVEEALTKNAPIHMRKGLRGQLHFEITIYPLDGSAETGVVILIENVTQQVLSENKLIERDKLSAVGELASVMAHDVNTPLQAIVKDLERAQEIASSVRDARNEASHQELYQTLTDARDETNRVAAISSNLLDFAGSRRDDLKPHDITKILDHSLELAEDIFSSVGDIQFSDISVVRQYEPGLPSIPCFASELQQVFLSLIRFSIYAFRGVDLEVRKPEIKVEVLKSYEALWIKIQHNGIGIDLDEQQVIFEPYFTDESPNFEDYDAGKRLSFPYFIVTEHHEGQMAVTSNVDVGTTFHIELRLS